MRSSFDKILQTLKDAKKISEKDAERVLAEYAKEPGAKLRDIILRMGLVTEKELLMIVSHELQAPFLNLAKYRINPEIGKIIPEKIARKHQIVPISKISETLTIAMWDPFNVMAVDDVELLTKKKIDIVVSTQKDIEDALNKLYPDKQNSLEDIAGEVEVSMESQDVEVIKEEDGGDGPGLVGAQTSDSPVVKIADLIVKQALKERTSDIHIEPMENKVRVRYRIDGGLRTVLEFPKKYQNALLARIKIMCQLDITETRIPQDGRFKVKLPEKEVDFRVSILPVYYGGKVVMRILDKSALSVGLDSLGFFPDTLNALKYAVAQPFGMILITGPTGSGKSTTLYSILNQLNTPERNVITIEDPIEYQVKGITQIQTRADIGMTFASGLRAILRQSPDVVMVGEIRDGETADIAIKASLTGQIVLSTLHTNDAPGAVTRLVDMGIEPFLVASSVVLTAAQRLCRRICNNCKMQDPIDAAALEKLGITEKESEGVPLVFYRGKGCDKCANTGNRGRVAVLEVLTITDSIRDMIVKGASSGEIKEVAVKKGMKSLRMDALRKALAGTISLDEVIRVTSEDE